MRAVIQRVRSAAVAVAGEEVGRIDHGALVLLGVLRGDCDDDARRLAQRVATFRMFSDAAGRMNHSLDDVAGAVLVVSQFTLAADGRKGRRPSFDRAAEPAEAARLYELFVESLRTAELAVATGQFGAMMQVELTNDGPVTFVFDEPRAE